MADITVKEAQEKKRKLEADLGELIHTFQKETGLGVTEVDVNLIQQINGKPVGTVVMVTTNLR